MASIFQLKDGRYVVQYWVKAERRYLREYFGRGLEGEKRAQDRLEELGRRPTGRRQSDKSRTFDFLFDAYLQAKRGQIRETTLDRMIIKFQSIILPELGAADACRLSPYRIDQYVNKRLRKKIKRVTIHTEISYIQAVLNWSVERGHIRRNPLAGYKKPTRDDAVVQPATAAEAVAILQHAPPHLQRALALSYYTGLRPGLQELLRLRWSDIDWDLRLILIRSARKGGPRARMVPIHSEFYPDLERWHKEDQADKSLAHDYIIHWQGKPILRISKAFSSAKKAAGITRKLPPYAFRHSFVTNLLAAGGDLKSTSQIAGHSRPDTTMRIYQHTNLEQQRREIEKLPPLIIDTCT